MIETIQSAFFSVGGAVQKFFRHDHTAAQPREKDPSAKRLKLSTTSAKSNGDGHEGVTAGFVDEVSGLKSGVASESHAGNASLGRGSLPSPPPSPRKRDVRQPHSKARRFLDRFRSSSSQYAFGPSLDNAFDATRKRPSTRDILKGKRRAASRQASKRAGPSRLPKPVRFTKILEKPEGPEAKPPVMDDLPSIIDKLTLESQPTASSAADEVFSDPLTSHYKPSYFKTREDDPANYDDRIEAIFDEKQPWSLELNTVVGDTIQAQRKTRVSDEEITREYIINLQQYDVRDPCRPLLLSLSEQMSKRTVSTIYAKPDAVLAKAADSTPLHRHDFCRVIPKTEWLNDEIVNGVLSWLDQAVNHIGGVDDPKSQTRKCLVMTSFYYKQIKTACKNTQRTLKRKGVTKENLLKVNTILLPICEHSHWTLMVINPSKKTVAHVDSLNPRGTKSVTDLALMWMKDALDEKFVPAEWSTIKYDHPAQTNGYDCGVHTICNAICVAVGVDPFAAYKAAEMPALRLQMSAVLVNGGFTGELDLLGF
ncbi:hypothetical protein LMH87_009775 [Akanthomyces muscarius]|uniref:Ubiquitin-like protease family profile domain-containing protein n=1 Tax=Akanthomyces muscarius TaxID=2231603 RepID=A0A9W8UM82_AKAMU|nr:hypothetical protein LMH87_009775 [Akanthomyces muscarius]KAJ4153280.1 hypothetical protein LMH87_009775 [Akanthomyces muscarius]